MLQRLKDESKHGIIHTFWFIVSRILFHSRLSSLIVFKVHSEELRYVLRFTRNATAMTTFVSGDIEKETSAFLRDNLSPGDVCIDVGANIGTISIPMSKRVGRHGAVLSFEANPKTFINLKKNIELNNIHNITTFNYALGDSKKMVYISDQKNDDMNHIEATLKTGVRVQMERLDKFTENISEIKLLKIDVEGYEKYVLKGAQKTISKTKIVLFEVNNANLENYDYNPREVFEIIEYFGFVIYETNHTIFNYKDTQNYRGNYYAIRAH